VVLSTGALVGKSSVGYGSGPHRSVRSVAAVVLMAMVAADAFGQPSRSTERNTAAAAENVRSIMRHVVLPNAGVLFDLSDERRWRATDLQASHHVRLTARERRQLQRVRRAAAALLAATARLEQPRGCSSGVAAPVSGASWEAGLSRLRDAIDDATDATNRDDIGAIAEAAIAVRAACTTCHDAYLDEPTRCFQ
jgi:hypothetical protein